MDAHARKTTYRLKQPFVRFPAAALAVLVVVGIGSNASAQEADLVRNFTPPAWLADVVQWSRDADENKIDDLIDPFEPPLHSIVVNYRRCVEQEDVDWLLDLNPGVIVLDLKLKYITSVALSEVAYPEIVAIAALDDVAFIEEQVDFTTTLNVSVPAIKVASGFYTPNTVQDQYPTIDGTGINIAILDTGVDNLTHQAFAATPFIGGYDALTKTFGDPVDTNGHGTHVACIALGQATVATSRGVAPGSGLVDVKAIPGTWAQVTDALETIYDKRKQWSVKIVNMSFGSANPAANDDGTDAFSQLVDLGESVGIVMVASAGNNGPANPGLSTPAAASRSIAVAAADDQATQDRTDDTIANFSSRGERANDGDNDVIDELKPEVAAPGVNIFAAQAGTVNGGVNKSGTSMAAPCVSGLASLVMQQNAGINAASVKEIIIRTAERRAGQWPPSSPGKDPEWNKKAGWGLIDGLAAVGYGQNTDLTFPHPNPTPSWLSPDISVSPSPKKGKQSTVTVQIDNRGPGYAAKAQILFGVYNYSASTPAFYHIGTRVVDLPVGVTPVSINWTPSISGHMCMKVEIGYGADTNYSNNKAQRNLNVAQSPVTFQVQNTLTETPEFIDFSYTFESEHDPQWTVEINPAFVTLGGDECPEEIEVLLLPPIGAPPCEEQMVHVAALIGEVELGGVTVQAFSTPPGDVNGDGSINGLDIAGFVRVKLGNPEPGDREACANFGTGSVEGDVVEFVGVLLED